MVFNVESKVPKIKPRDWLLFINGEVKKSLSFSLSELQSDFKPKSVQANIICLKGSTISGKWTGVPVQQLLNIANPKKSAAWIQIKAYSNYSEPLKIKDFQKENIILAYNLNDKPIPPQQGGSLRLIVPNKYAYKSVKWVREFTILSQKPSGFWEKKGYPYKDST